MGMPRDLMQLADSAMFGSSEFIFWISILLTDRRFHHLEPPLSAPSPHHSAREASSACPPMPHFVGSVKSQHDHANTAHLRGVQLVSLVNTTIDASRTPVEQVVV